MASLPTESLSDYLSGILIGLEIGGSMALCGSLPRHIHLIGADDLCMRYVNALRTVNIHAVMSHTAATAGLWKLATTAGLVKA